MRHIPRKSIAVFAAVLTFAAVAVALFFFLYDLIGEQEFTNLTLRLIGIGALCGIIAIAGVSLARLEDPREEVSIYHAEDPRLH